MNAPTSDIAMHTQPTPNMEACRSLFGQYPEDVISTIKCAAEALSWLEEILRTISSDVLDARNRGRIKRLADAGVHLGFDVGEYAETQHEDMTDHLRAAGALGPEATSQAEGGAR
jgi:hypothetical protein